MQSFGAHVLEIRRQVRQVERWGERSDEGYGQKGAEFVGDFLYAGGHAGTVHRNRSDDRNRGHRHRGTRAGA